MTTSEPRWTEMDRAEALALAMHRDSLCPLCGKPLDVCGANEKTGPAPKFSVEYTACRATMAILDTQRGLFGEDKKPNPYAPAFLFAATTRR